MPCGNFAVEGVSRQSAHKYCITKPNQAETAAQVEKMSTYTDLHEESLFSQRFIW